jgi:hypothetical protein
MSGGGFFCHEAAGIDDNNNLSGPQPPKKTDQRMLQRHLSLWKVKKGFN